tara:strand:+ start:185 stop:532 length:348 start_codon:yes stop_codon:yes gene_type:complete
MPGGSKKGGGLTTKKSAFYKMKGSPMQRNFPGMTAADAGSPLEHTTNRIGHEEKYGKKHDNSAHKDYWKKTKTRHEKYNPEKYPKATTSRKEREIELSNYIKKHGGIPSGLPTVR